MHFNCPKCGMKYQAPERLAGRRYRCKGCGAIDVVPGIPIDPAPSHLEEAEAGGDPAGPDDRSSSPSAFAGDSPGESREEQPAVSTRSTLLERAAGRPQDRADLSQLGLDEGGESERR